MLKKIIFKLDNDRYFINLKKNLLIASNREKSTREIYQLDNIEIGDDWIVMEVTLSAQDAMIWDIEDIDIEFIYAKDK